MLAIGLLRVLLRRLFAFGPRGLPAFQQHYLSDGLSPVSSPQRQLLLEGGGCTACGRCDEGESARIQEAGGAYTGVMSIVLGASRNMPDYGVTARALDFVPDAVLVDKEQNCPVRVPIVALAALLRDKAADARGGSPVTVSPQSQPPPARG